MKATKKRASDQQIKEMTARKVEQLRQAQSSLVQAKKEGAFIARASGTKLADINAVITLLMYCKSKGITATESNLIGIVKSHTGKSLYEHRRISDYASTAMHRALYDITLDTMRVARNANGQVAYAHGVIIGHRVGQLGVTRDGYIELFPDVKVTIPSPAQLKQTCKYLVERTCK